MPSPTMMVGWSRCSERTASTLSAGTRSASTASRSSAAPIAWAAAARSPVTMTMRAMPAWRSMRMARGVSARSSSASSSAPIGLPSTAMNTISADRHEARRTARIAHSGAFWRAKIMSREPALTRRPSTTPCRPEPMDSRTCSGIFRARPRSAAACDDGGGENVMRGLLQRGAEHQHLVGALARGHLDREEPRAADGQRAGLVEQHGVGARQRLERAAALDQDAAPGRLRDAGDEGDRRGQDERARRRRHQHGQAADEIAGDEPGDEGERQRDRQEHQRIAVGKPHERRLGGLRRGHQTHDAGIGALAGDRDAVISNVSPVFNAPLKAAAPRALTTGIGSPVNADLSIVAICEVTMPSTGTTSPARTSSRSPDGDLADRHVLDALADAAMRHARRAIDQRAQIVLGAGDRDVLEHIAAGIHQRDHRAGKRLAERQRRAHRHQRDGIDAEPPGEEVAHDRDGKARPPPEPWPTSSTDRQYMAGQPCRREFRRPIP